MNYELVKKEFIKLKKEEFNYINHVSEISRTKTLIEEEKLEIHRTLKDYENKLDKMYSKLFEALTNEIELTSENLKDIIIEFNIDKSFLSSISDEYDYIKEFIFNELGVNPISFKYKLTIHNLLRHKTRDCYKEIGFDMLLNGQKLLEEPVFIFRGYYDAREDCYEPWLGNPDEYLYGIYKNICIKNNTTIDILEKDMKKFEEDKMIIHTKDYVGCIEAEKIFEEELLNKRNKTIKDCIVLTEKRIEKLNYTRTPEYKEKVLLEKIKDIYKPVKGEYIKSETLYTGNFLELIKETYQLPNGKYVDKEKIIKNKGKASVVVIPITIDNEYILTFQNRVKRELFAEFPSGYIEINEDALETAKRELEEETGYTSNDLFVVDGTYTSPGIDNSITYIVIANNCEKKCEPTNNGSELVNYGLFLEKELEYMANTNIIYGAMNKLAYYNLINNVETCNIGNINSKIKTYKRLKDKKNPLDS